MSTRRKYDLGYNLRAIQKKESTGNRQASAQLWIDKSLIRDWRKHKNEVETNSQRTSAKKCRLPGAGRKAAFETEEEQLTKWVLEQRELHLRVTRLRSGKESERDDSR